MEFKWKQTLSQRDSILSEVSRKDVSGDDFVYENQVQCAGRVSKVFRNKDSVTFILSCTDHRRRSSASEPKRDRIFVRFFDNTAKVYYERFKEGSFIAVEGILQSVKDPFTGHNSTAVWGLTAQTSTPGNDFNSFNLCGKVSSVTKISPRYLLLVVDISVDKSYFNPNKNGRADVLKQSFKCNVPLGVRCSEDRLADLTTIYTPGTWISGKGSLQVKGKEIRPICDRLPQVIGNVQ